MSTDTQLHLDTSDEAMRQDAYERAAAATTAAVQRLREGYPAAAAFIAELMRELRKAQAMVDAINADLPAGARKLPDVEAFRGRPSRGPQMVDGVFVPGVTGYRPPHMSSTVVLPGLIQDDPQAWPV